MAGKTNNKKNTGGRKKSSSSASKGRKVQEESSFLSEEVFIIVAFAAAVLLFLSNFHLCGAFGEVLRSVQLGIFGMIGFAAPILLFVGTCFILANKGSALAKVKMAAVVAGVWFLCGFAEFFFGSGYLKGQALGDIYQKCAATGMGGGFLGGVLVMGIGSVLGSVGAFLVLLVGLVICVVCITEKSLVGAVKKGGGKAYQHAKADVDRRRVIHEEKKEEKRRLREEQRVRGVDLSSTTIEENPGRAPEKDSVENIRILPSGGDDDFREETDISGDGQNARKRQEEFDPEVGNQGFMDDLLPDSYKNSGKGWNSADVFTGRISMPPVYIDTEEDTVPFDADGFADADMEETDAEYGGYADGEPGPFPYLPEPSGEEEGEEIPSGEELYAPRDYRTLGEMDVRDGEIRMEEGEKRVVTATGKIIESDTEALQKKLESSRKEAAEEKFGQVPAPAEKKPPVKKPYVFPPLSLLTVGKSGSGTGSDKEYRETAIKLQQTLRDFGVGVTVTNVSCGPTVTRYELHPEQGVKVSKIVGLADDIKLSLAAADIRIEAPIPGKSAVGIEVPNKENNTVYLRELLEAEEFKNSASRLSFAVGKDIGGQVIVTDIAKMPHLLIAGSTGSGKSVCINTLIMSIIYKSRPDDVKLIMVDPKVVELSAYNGIPHLLIPVVTDPKKASGALNWAVAEMDDRYKKFAECGVRDLKGYNARIDGLRDIPEEERPARLPQIVIIIDELADLMMVAPGEVEGSICRLAQLARAAGLHLVIATQRPSVNVITGLIKANVPSRIAFAVSSGVDSRTILDMYGAEKLLGKGDMLFFPSGIPKPLRVQGAFVSDSEVSKVVDFLKKQQDEAPAYDLNIESQIAVPQAAEESRSDRDEYFAQAGRFIIEKEKASIGMLQRMFKIGFNRAARIMDQLAEAGVVGEEEGTKPRKILMTAEEFEGMLKQ